jgi:hypothetical protein
VNFEEGKVAVTNLALKGRRLRAFVSYLYALDRGAFERLLAQSYLPDSPFDIVGASHRLTADAGWGCRLRDELADCDFVIAIAPPITKAGTNVSYERELARELGLPELVVANDAEVDHGQPNVARTWDSLKAAVFALCS